MPAKFFFLTLFFFGFFTAYYLDGEEVQKKGTLIVSYQTGPKGERLDRIRFWLKGENKFLQMFPKDAHVVEDNEEMTRTVVIDDLNPGSYTIEFIIPNTDGLFEPILPKTVAIERGAIVKVNQLIKPHFATVDIQAQNEKGAPPLTKNPSIILKTPLGHIEAHAETDQISVPQLLPGAYSVIFGDIEGYITPSPIEIHLRASERAGPVIGIYKSLSSDSDADSSFSPLSFLRLIYGSLVADEVRHEPSQINWKNEDLISLHLGEEPSGSLFIAYSLKPDYEEIEQIRFRIPEYSSTKLFPKKSDVIEDPSLKEWIVFLQNIPAGQYTLVFYHAGSQENLTELKQVPFEIFAERMTTVEEAFSSNNLTEHLAFNQISTVGIPPKIEIIGNEQKSITEHEPIPLPKQLNRNLIHQQESTSNDPPQTRGQLLIVSNVSDAGFTLFEQKESKDLKKNHYKGMMASIEIDPTSSYKIVFDQLENYEPKEPIYVQLKGNQKKLVTATYLIKQKWLPIPAGPSIFGDPFGDGHPDEQPAQKVEIDAFSVSQYAVTNAQFANWLNKAYKEEKIFFSKEGEKSGIITDINQKVLAKTIESEPLSQIITHREGFDAVHFAPLPGKENHPVIFVSWFGADAYCKDHQGRLPTEAEWEKVAGVSAENRTLKKYKFGFSRDTIDAAWANFKDNEDEIKTVQVLSKSVGFYNGINWLQSSENNPRPIQTHNALSPSGAYDMSGNVYEWVFDWYDPNYLAHLDFNNPSGPAEGTEKIGKGGCFDSLAQSLRISERLPLPIEHTDPFTGFRMVKTQ